MKKYGIGHKYFLSYNAADINNLIKGINHG
jgi:hypothetical protein